jgi:chromosome segregation ATPase
MKEEELDRTTLGIREDLQKILFVMMKEEHSGELSDEVRKGADSVRRAIDRIDYLEEQLDETDRCYKQLRRFCLEDQEKISQLNASARESKKKYSNELSLLEEQLAEMREAHKECEEELKAARENETNSQRELRDLSEQARAMCGEINNLRWGAGIAGFFAIILLMILAGH